MTVWRPLHVGTLCLPRQQAWGWKKEIRLRDVKFGLGLTHRVQDLGFDVYKRALFRDFCKSGHAPIILDGFMMGLHKVVATD